MGLLSFPERKLHFSGLELTPFGILGFTPTLVWLRRKLLDPPLFDKAALVPYASAV